MPQQACRWERTNKKTKSRFSPARRPLAGSGSAAARALPAGGTVMYAMLALAGDLGCASGPAAAGAVAGAFGGALRPAMAFSVVFPVLLLIGIRLYRRTAEKG